MKRFFLIFTCLLLISCVLLTACGDKNKGNDDSTGNKETAAQTTGGNKDTDATTDGESKNEDSAEGKTDEESGFESETDGETTDAESAEKEDEEDDDTKDEEEFVAPRFTNPLTGLPTLYDITKKRPVSIIVNNIDVSLPQEGISQADVLYECLAEGGITRLLCLITDYSKIGEIGSIRSVRDYYLDFVQNHDAILVHAGGSPDGYAGIKERDIDNVDGVNNPPPNVFYRNQERRQSMGYENSLMSDGQKIVSGIVYLKYRTNIKDGFNSPLDFVKYGTSADMSNGQAAEHVYIPFSTYEIVDMVYNAETGLYDRSQFDGVPHVDSETGEQLSFKNIFILFCDSGLVPGDDKDRIYVGTTGSDTCYYITDGKAIEVKWSKETRDSEIVFTHLDGTPLEINRGKTYIAVAPQIRDKVLLNKAD